MWDEDMQRVVEPGEFDDHDRDPTPPRCRRRRSPSPGSATMTRNGRRNAIKAIAGLSALTAMRPSPRRLACRASRAAFAAAASAPYKDPTLPVEARVKDLLARMTLEEKVGADDRAVVHQGARCSPTAARTSRPAKASKAYPDGFGQVTRPSDRKGAPADPGHALAHHRRHRRAS